MEEIKRMLVNGYKEIAFTDKYIYGFIYKKVVYVSFSNDDTLEILSTLDKGSRGSGYSLRFKPNKFQKELLRTNGTCFALCSEEFFNSEVENSIHNKGSIFEKMVTEYYGQEWKKDTIPFTETGDLEIDGIAYQIKFEKATFTTEKTLANLRKKKKEA